MYLCIKSKVSHIAQQAFAQHLWSPSRSPSSPEDMVEHLREEGGGLWKKQRWQGGCSTSLVLKTDSGDEKPFRCHMRFCRLENFIWETCKEGHVGVLCGAIKKSKTQALLLQPGDLLLK